MPRVENLRFFFGTARTAYNTAYNSIVVRIENLDKKLKIVKIISVAVNTCFLRIRLATIIVIVC